MLSRLNSIQKSLGQRRPGTIEVFYKSGTTVSRTGDGPALTESELARAQAEADTVILIEYVEEG